MPASRTWPRDERGAAIASETLRAAPPETSGPSIGLSYRGSGVDRRDGGVVHSDQSQIRRDLDVTGRTQRRWECDCKGMG